MIQLLLLLLHHPLLLLLVLPVVVGVQALIVEASWPGALFRPVPRRRHHLTRRPVYRSARTAVA
jgi:hypothetical protein